MILVNRKIRHETLTFLKLDNGTYVHLSDFIRFYDDVKSLSFEYENYTKDFLDKIFFAFRKNCRSIIVRKNDFKTGTLFHKYYIDADIMNEWLEGIEKFLEAKKSQNNINKKLLKIKKLM